MIISDPWQPEFGGSSTLLFTVSNALARRSYGLRRVHAERTCLAYVRGTARHELQSSETRRLEGFLYPGVPRQPER